MAMTIGTKAVIQHTKTAAPSYLRPESLAALCADAYLVERPQDVLGVVRGGPAVWRARQLVMLLLYEERTWSVTAIARALGKDHSTVCHGLARARAERETEMGGKAYRYVQGEIARLRAQTLATARKDQVPRHGVLPHQGQVAAR